MSANLPPPSSDSPDAKGIRRAAVLAPLQLIDNEWHLLLIRRSLRDGDRHSGQVAFPGGRVEPEDASLTAAALREAQEEIGLPTSNVQVLTQLSDYITITEYLVTPVVGVVNKPFTPVLQPQEVSRLFSIPLTWLSDTTNHERRTWNPDRPKVVFFKEWEGETLWGATAAMTLHLINALQNGDFVLPKGGDR